jgi:hypothetical protein
MDIGLVHMKYHRNPSTSLYMYPSLIKDLKPTTTDPIYSKITQDGFQELNRHKMTIIMQKKDAYKLSTHK